MACSVAAPSETHTGSFSPCPGAASAWPFPPMARAWRRRATARPSESWTRPPAENSVSCAGHTNLVSSIAFSPDGTRLASAEGNPWGFGWDTSAPPFAVRIWETATGKELPALVESAHGFNAVAFSPNGKLLAAAGDDNLSVWELATGKQLAHLRRKVASPSPSRPTERVWRWRRAGRASIRILDVATGKVLFLLTDHASTAHVCCLLAGWGAAWLRRTGTTRPS